MGVPLIAIGNGNKHFATKYKEGIGFSGEIYLDPQSKSFEMLNLHRLSAWETMKRFFSPKALKTSKELFSKYKNADLQGDGQQTGGVFVVGPGVGQPLRFSFYENEHDTDTFANNDDILAALSQTEKPGNSSKI